MRWYKYPPLYWEWHTWFAWYPVYLPASGQWVWLENVARRRVQGPFDGPTYTYGELE